MVHHIASSEEHAAYQATAQFKAYLEAKAIWEEAHGIYSTYSSDANRERLLDSQRFMDAHLELARQTPEHKAAFGW